MWVSEQSGLYALDKLDIRVEKHTQLDGAVLNSDTGDLKLDTGTLGFKNIFDHDKGQSIGGQVSLSYTADYDKNGDGIVDKGTGGPGGNLSGAYEMHDIEQTTKATVGEGEIVIRNEDKQKQDVAALNRDITQSQVITKDERAGVKVYVSDTAIRAALDTLKEIGATLKDAFAAGLDQTDLDPKTKKAVLKLTKDVLDGKISLSALRSCGQQGFNLHNLLFTPAHAAGPCEQYSREEINICVGTFDKL